MVKKFTKKGAISKYEALVTTASSEIESLEWRYKRVIDELRKQRDYWKNNAWKSIFVKLINRLKRGGEYE